MDRRALLRRSAVAGAAALAGSVAGCLGGGGDSRDDGDGYEDLTIDDFDAVEGDDGELVVTVTVANLAAEDRTGTLYVNVKANGSANTRVRTVEVGPAGTTDLEVPFDVSYETFMDAGNLDFDFDEA